MSEFELIVLKIAMASFALISMLFVLIHLVIGLLEGQAA